MIGVITHPFPAVSKTASIAPEEPVKSTVIVAVLDSTFRVGWLLLERQNLSPYGGLDGQPQAQVFLADAQGLLAGIAHLAVWRGGLGVVQRRDDPVGNLLRLFMPGQRQRD